MKTFIASLVLAISLAFPAFAQSYDPAIGSGNLAPSYSTTNDVAPGYSARGNVGAGLNNNVARSAATAAFAAVTPFGSPTASSAARDSALRDCVTLSRRYTQTTWGTMEIQQFRSCMVQHGQVE